jgi:hypothetical protein
MSQLERSDYLAAFGVPAFLYVESTDAIEVSTQKICRALHLRLNTVANSPQHQPMS